MFSPQTVRFEEDSSLFEPGKEVVILTLEFNIAEVAVAEDLAADTNV